MIEFVALMDSCLLEGPSSYWIGRQTKWPCRGAVHMGLASLAATAITHPQAWALMSAFGPKLGFFPIFFFIELGVIATEGLLIAWMANLPINRALVASLIANGCSAMAGLWCNKAILPHLPIILMGLFVIQCLLTALEAIFLRHLTKLTPKQAWLSVGIPNTLTIVYGILKSTIF